jgi:hypothetical protein
MGSWCYSNVGIECENASEEQIVRLMECLGFERVKDDDLPYCEAGEMSFCAGKDDGKSV